MAMKLYNISKGYYGCFSQYDEINKPNTSLYERQSCFTIIILYISFVRSFDMKTPIIHRPWIDIISVPRYYLFYFPSLSPSLFLSPLYKAAASINYVSEEKCIVVCWRCIALRLFCNVSFFDFFLDYKKVLIILKYIYKHNPSFT